jgi:hypothetical protein
MADTKHFPFLELLAELRNQIYENIAALNTGPEQDWAHEYIGMTQACKQVRAELRPLYWRNLPAHATVKSPNLDAFIDLFLDPAMSLPHISRVNVNIVDKDKQLNLAWNALPLLSAKAQNPTVVWKFELVGPDSYVYDSDLRCALLWITNNSPRCLRRDVESGMFTEISLHISKDEENRTFGWEWHVGVENGTGRLAQQDKTKIAGYCDLFARCFGRFYWFSWHRPTIAKVDVRRRNGRLVEKYVWTWAASGWHEMVRVKSGRKGKKSGRGK